MDQVWAACAGFRVRLRRPGMTVVLIPQPNPSFPHRFTIIPFRSTVIPAKAGIQHSELQQ